MTPERQVFLTDGLVGIGPATVGVLTFGPEAGWLALPVALVVAALIAGVNYYDEHVGFERTLGEGVVSVGAVVAPFLVSLLLFYLGSPLAVSVSLGGFVGLSLGFLGYRVVYGIVRPIPERRLERAREQSA
jgi:hypothetical protein